MSDIARCPHCGQEMPDLRIPYVAVVDMFNRITGKRVSARGNKVRDRIRARWKEGYTFADFEAVVTNMTRATADGTWGLDGRDMSHFLHPNTIFGPEFDKYLNWNAGKPAGRPLVPAWSDVLREKGLSDA